MIERGDLIRVADVLAATLHEDAPSLVVHAVGVVDLDGHRRAVRALLNHAVVPYPDDDAVAGHRVVHREDGDAPVGNDTDPAHPMGLEAPDALVTLEALEVVGGRRRHRVQAPPGAPTLAAVLAAPPVLSALVVADMDVPPRRPVSAGHVGRP